MLNKPANLFLLITVLVFVVVFGRGIFSNGMFFDGILYATVARNYANGYGSFWQMQFNPILQAGYHDQPPLTFFLQSLFFKLLGDSIYVERLYCLLFALIHLLLIRELWFEFNGRKNQHAWIPMLMWIIIPLSSWTFQNNLQEVTMGAFDLAAVLFLLKGCKRNNVLFLILGSIFTFLASFCKGIQGFFPVVIPLLYWFVYRNMNLKKVFGQLLFVISVPAVIYFLFFLSPAAHQSLSQYLSQRISGTFHHDQDTTKTHFYLLYILVLQLLVPLVVLIFFYITSRLKHFEYNSDKKPVILFVLIGITASLPLMVTLEQRPFYLATSLPYFATAIALFVLPYIKFISEMWVIRKYNTIYICLITFILVSIIFISVNLHKPKRDHLLIGDLSIIREHIPEMTMVSTPIDMELNWAYHAYFMRYCSIGLDGRKNHSYFLAEKENTSSIDTSYKLMDLPLQKFRLYEHNIPDVN